MKKTIYSIFFACVCLTALSSCGGHEEYDAYVAKLKAQPAVIDTISSRASYAIYLDSLAVQANAFEQIGVKLDPTQKDELATLSMLIQEKLTAKYNQLAQQPAMAYVTLEASMPVEAFDEGGKDVVTE